MFLSPKTLSILPTEGKTLPKTFYHGAGYAALFLENEYGQSACIKC